MDEGLKIQPNGMAKFSACAMEPCSHHPLLTRRHSVGDDALSDRVSLDLVEDVNAINCRDDDRTGLTYGMLRVRERLARRRISNREHQAFSALGKRAKSFKVDGERVMSLDEIQTVLEGRLDGKNFTICVLGPAGEGKSTLINTLLLSPVCEVGRGPGARTHGISQTVHSVALGNDKRADLKVYDSAGLRGNPAEDEHVKRQLRELEPDLVIVCFSMDAHAGRSFPVVQDFTLGHLRQVWKDDAILRKKTIIVLTKANVVFEDYKKDFLLQMSARTDEDNFGVEKATLQAAEAVNRDFEEWKRDFQERNHDNVFGSVPIVIAGRVEFANGKPTRLTPIGKQSEWLHQLWEVVGIAVDENLAALFHYVIIETRGNSDVLEDFREKLREFNGILLKKGAAVAGATAVLIGVGAVAIALTPITLGVSLGLAGAAVGLGAIALGKLGKDNLRVRKKRMSDLTIQNPTTFLKEV